MHALIRVALGSLFALAFATPAPVIAQDSGAGEIIVTAERRQGKYYVEAKPVVGLRRQADSAVQKITITSDSREAAMRQREVQAMLMDAIDRARTNGLSLVTGRFELVEVTRKNWQDLFPGLARKMADEDEEEDYEDEDDEYGRAPTYEDDGDSATLRLMVKARLAGSVGGTQGQIDGFARSVPATGRSQLEQDGDLALTIVNPDQYRDEIIRRVAEAAKHTASFFGPDYRVEVSGLDKDVAWAQVSNTEVFLYLPYSFSVGR